MTTNSRGESNGSVSRIRLELSPGALRLLDTLADTSRVSRGEMIGIALRQLVATNSTIAECQMIAQRSGETMEEIRQGFALITDMILDAYRSPLERSEAALGVTSPTPAARRRG